MRPDDSVTQNDPQLFGYMTANSSRKRKALLLVRSFPCVTIFLCLLTYFQALLAAARLSSILPWGTQRRHRHSNRLSLHDRRLDQTHSPDQESRPGDSDHRANSKEPLSRSMRALQNHQRAAAGPRRIHNPQRRIAHRSMSFRFQEPCPEHPQHPHRPPPRGHPRR